MNKYRSARRSPATVQIHGPGRLAFALALLFVASASCTPAGATKANTAWLRHIKTPTVSSAPTHPDRLIAELRTPALDRNSYTSAEQIAANAVYELQQGREWDAALLLSLASYRYHQQAILAGEIGREQLPRIHPSRYRDFADIVSGEVKLFNDQDFDSELDLLRDHLFGAAMASERRDRYIEELARGGREQADFAQKLSDFQTRLSNRPETLLHGQLASAFQARLLADNLADQRARQRAGFAFYYLAATPLDDFRLAALDRVKIPFHAILVRNMTPRMKTLRAQVRTRLQSSRPDTRANAAILLGLAPEASDLPDLEARMAEETDPRVVDSLRFALVRHQRSEFLKPLLERARRTRGRERDHVLVLLQWLPETVKTGFEESTFLPIANRPNASPFSRSMALVIIGDIARQRAVTQRAVRTLLRLGGTDNKVVAASAQLAIKQLQLSAAECKSFYREYRAVRPSLLNRLAQIATLHDLEFLDRAYTEGLAENLRDPESAGSDVQSAAIQATANVPGSASRQLLERWLVDAAHDSGVRWLLALVLAARDDADQTRLSGLANLTRGTRMMVLLALDTTDLPERMGRALPELSIDDIAQLAMMSSMLERRSLRAVMWQLASYDDYRFYPADAMVRRLAMSALFRIALRDRIEQPATALPMAPPGRAPPARSPVRSPSGDS